MIPLSSCLTHPLFEIENLYCAYRRCRRRKRHTVNAMAFELDLEKNLFDLQAELREGRYRPGPSLAFLVSRPKMREIFAADFRDRVVHHLLVGHLERGWERRFIHDSYACRQGRGTYNGVKRVQKFSRSVTGNDTAPAWYLQLDVRGFFVSINRNILYQRLAARESDPVILWLLKTILFAEVTEGCRVKGCKMTDFLRLPPHKTLFKAARDCGLPIGNLTSQFFANVYLDALDQFVKHTLKARHYLRYCDDFVLLSRDREELARWEGEIEKFLETTLQLALNQRRKLRPVRDGIDFLGYIIRPGYLLVRRRVVGALKEKLGNAETGLRRLGMLKTASGHQVFPWPQAEIEEIRQWLNSYLGHLSKACCHNLQLHLRQRFFWLDEFFQWQGYRVLPRCPTPRFTLSYARQQAWFAARLPGHFLLIRRGSRVDIIAPAAKAGQDGQEILSKQPSCRLTASALRRVSRKLWAARLPVAFIDETGRRLSTIAERSLTGRWSFSQKKEEKCPCGIKTGFRLRACRNDEQQALIPAKGLPE